MELYSNLPYDASEAAIDISNYILGEKHPINYQNIIKISEYLYNIPQNDWIDPHTTIMLAEGIWPNKKDWKGKTDGNLRVQTNLFAKDLASFTELSRKKQETLMNTCVDVSRVTIRRFQELRSTYLLNSKHFYNLL